MLCELQEEAVWLRAFVAQELGDEIWTISVSLPCSHLSPGSVISWGLERQWSKLFLEGLYWLPTGPWDFFCWPLSGWPEPISVRNVRPPFKIRATHQAWITTGQISPSLRRSQPWLFGVLNLVVSEKCSHSCRWCWELYHSSMLSIWSCSLCAGPTPE